MATKVYSVSWLDDKVIPALLKTQYADNPVFADAQLMYTAYPNEMAGSIAEDFTDQFLEDTALTEEDLALMAQVQRKIYTRERFLC